FLLVYVGVLLAMLGLLVLTWVVWRLGE
ncbi:hypothetical protein LCGC14_2934740, partial [marine sediment metagenome]